MKAKQRALVLGASGGIGGELAVRLLQRGWEVHALQHRSRMTGTRGNGIYWWRGDAMQREDVLQAAKGASLIVHAVDSLLWRDTGSQPLAMLEHSIEAAVANRARVLLPAPMSVYGAASGLLDEDAPQRPLGQRGLLQVRMEQRLQAATAEGAQALIVRSGDYFGPHAVRSWFSQALVEPGRALSSLRYPGRAGTGHAWCYLPDAAEAMLRLLERAERLGAFERFHLQGHWDADGGAMVAAIARAAAGARLRVKPFPWSLLRRSAPLLPLFRELSELRTHWQEPQRPDNRRLLALLGEEPRTDLDSAVRETLYAMGCIDSAAPKRAAARKRKPAAGAALAAAA
ncbi:NAD-dependent epimerase/dehydratase family protein [Lysobacter silvisoli]|uniref:NAD-dependent epimerase/dehydratase family protein n=1 Tax=Lysobacter silvisoli TaxID=2293254 RepID=A0A371K0P0_9GAMM|nr:NAD-dependent epimerase/dehydratase family protein [Lysobacter silvisoli]RDZ27412.1 NAD-dependent epimerase/dehydratase family protein [Lysobacter silvisoli]